jgi:hypothetical protein
MLKSLKGKKMSNESLKVQHYDISHIFNNQNTKNVANSIFSLGLEKNVNLIEDKKQFSIHSTEIKKNVKDDKSISYLYNNDGYRCDNFVVKNKKSRAIFSGCSETEGVGNNIEDTWSFLTYQQLLKSNDLDGYFNLGLSGSGHNRIISNIINHIKIYGNPNYIFILFPNIARWTEWIDDEIEYMNIGLGPYQTDILDKDFTSIKKQRDLMIHFISIMKIFELFCYQNKIKLFWSTWEAADEENYKFLSDQNIFNNFIYINNLNIRHFIKGEIKNNQNDRYFLARDNHLGTGFHKYFANGFISKI